MVTVMAIELSDLRSSSDLVHVAYTRRSSSLIWREKALSASIETFAQANGWLVESRLIVTPAKRLEGLYPEAV